MGKQNFAYKEALERHITEMEIRASEAVKERQQSAAPAEPPRVAAASSVVCPWRTADIPSRRTTE